MCLGSGCEFAAGAGIADGRMAVLPRHGHRRCSVLSDWYPKLDKEQREEYREKMRYDFLASATFPSAWRSRVLALISNVAQTKSAGCGSAAR
jgi:hypothetical protein